jgi:hypothetical protein
MLKPFGPLLWGLHRLPTEKRQQVLQVICGKGDSGHERVFVIHELLEIAFQKRMELPLGILNLNGIVTVVLGDS